jgi:hypothetical protein
MYLEINFVDGDIPEPGLLRREDKVYLRMGVQKWASGQDIRQH